MRVIKIDKKDWESGVEKLSGDYSLYGPVKQGAFHNFAPLEKGQMPDLDYVNTRLSPKSVVYPQCETMFEYTLDENQPDHHVNKEIPKDYSPRAILGIRPCDVKAIDLVNINFDNPQYQDPWWVQRRAALTTVALACNNPCSTCFCTTAGTGPFDDSSADVLLADMGDYYLAKVMTEKGEALVGKAGFDQDGSAEAGAIDDAAKAAEAKITSKIETNKLGDKVTTELYDADFWEDVAFACINCGTCTYLCPTCWCFDIQDEVQGSDGCRMRNWDTCMSALFTLHGTGHNPRPNKTARVRQRFMHKLKYYVDKYENGIACVGCGRCVQQCPVNIDIRRVCDLMNRFEPGKECA